LNRLAGGLVLAALWEIAGRRSDSFLFPSFTETLAALVTLASSSELWRALWVSNQALAVGFFASLAVGLPLGLLLGRAPRMDAAVHPYVNLLIVLPTTALIPVVFILGGLGLAARALVVCVFSMPIVVECTRTALREADPRLRDMAAAFCASKAQLWRKVLLPAAVPGMLTGVRLGLARAVEGMVVVELLLVAVGVGQLLLDFQGRFDAPFVYAVILVVMAEAALLTQAGRGLERRLLPFQAAGTSDRD
jgi:NitT/TauT family transport system permease protein